MRQISKIKCRKSIESEVVDCPHIKEANILRHIKTQIPLLSYKMSKIRVFKNFTSDKFERSCRLLLMLNVCTKTLSQSSEVNVAKCHTLLSTSIQLHPQ